MIAELLKIAEAELGYLEKASNSQLEDKTANAGSGNFTKYGEWFGQNPAQWCAMFVSWCMERAGAGALAPKYSYCYSGIEWFKAKASFHEKAGYTPQGGDVIFFSSPSMPRGGAHTGLVLRSDEKLVYTIEGNTSGGSTLVSNGGGVAKKS
ncbi:MAG: CHAP domain-containing protein, partial [Oscillospiraceae bacterium]